MNATESKAKIIAAERRIEELRAGINRLEDRRTNLLRDMPVEPSAAYQDQKLAGFLSEVEGDLEAARAELKRLKEQVEVLRDGLPSADEVAAADERVSALLESAGDYTTEFQISWAAVLDNLAEAESAARDLITFRDRHRAAVQEAAELVRSWGLEREDVPACPPRTGPEKLVGKAAEVDLTNALLDVVKGAVNGDLEADRAATSRAADLRSKLRAQESAAA